MFDRGKAVQAPMLLEVIFLSSYPVLLTLTEQQSKNVFVSSDANFHIMSFTEKHCIHALTMFW